MLRARSSQRRQGATTIEMAVVAGIASLLLFGIMEFCLIVYTYNVVDNAAREGARFAVVNTTEDTMITDTKAVVKNFMSGIDTKMEDYQCEIYLADTQGNNIGNATDAVFGQHICVDVRVDYVPLTPGLGFLKKFTIRSKCSMGSEAN